MFFRLLLAFTVLPALELYLLVHLGQAIGVLETIYLVVFTGIVGAALAKREGLSVIREIQAEATSGHAPAGQLVEGLLILLGGVLLLTPGVITDLWGFSCILPWTRRAMAPRLQAWLAARVTVMDGVTVGTPKPGPAAVQVQGRFDHPVI